MNLIKYNDFTTWYLPAFHKRYVSIKSSKAFTLTIEAYLVSHFFYVVSWFHRSPNNCGGITRNWRQVQLVKLYQVSNWFKLSSTCFVLSKMNSWLWNGISIPAIFRLCSFICSLVVFYNIYGVYIMFLKYTYLLCFTFCIYS